MNCKHFSGTFTVSDINIKTGQQLTNLVSGQSEVRYEPTPRPYKDLFELLDAVTPDAEETARGSALNFMDEFSSSITTLETHIEEDPANKVISNRLKSS